MKQRINKSRADRRWLKSQNKKWPANPLALPPEQWQHLDNNPENRIAVWRSRDYLIQIFREKNDVIRLSVNRSVLRPDGLWEDCITWDELNWIKRKVGYGDRYGIEIFPPDQDIINVANMRHIWILPRPLDVGWKSKNTREFKINCHEFSS